MVYLESNSPIHFWGELLLKDGGTIFLGGGCRGTPTKNQPIFLASPVLTNTNCSVSRTTPAVVRTRGHEDPSHVQTKAKAPRLVALAPVGH